jgi:hypothetical protein
MNEIYDKMIKTSLTEGGLHLVASKGFGKTRLLFNIAESIRNLADSRVIIFDGSLAWLYGYNAIPTFNINEEDITLSDVKTTQDIERYTLNNLELVKFALNTKKDILFRLKTRKPSKRGFFIRTVINYLDAQQRAQREINADHEATLNIAYFIEEAQDAFNSRSTTRLESEEFLTTFNEARNQRESFFTASQRLNDFSKTIRTKQSYCIGKINPEDINPSIREIEKEANVNLAKMSLRTWLYNEELLTSPDWTQQGRPFICNRELKQLFNAEKTLTSKEKPTLLKRLFSKFL